MRFSLRTLLVIVTLVGIWLGYAIPRIKLRHAFLAQPDVLCEFNDTPPSTFNKSHTKAPVYAPLPLRLLGERGAVSTWLGPKVWSPTIQAEAERLFPEALVLKIHPGPYPGGNWGAVRD